MNTVTCSIQYVSKIKRDPRNTNQQEGRGNKNSSTKKINNTEPSFELAYILVALSKSPNANNACGPGGRAGLGWQPEGY